MADMIYDTNWCPDGTLGNSTGIREWWDHEHIPINMAFDNTTFNQVLNIIHDLFTFLS